MSATPWDHAMTALRLLAHDPAGLGGIWVKARVGPARDAFLAACDRLSGPKTARLTPFMSEDALFGGLDIGQTLTLGKPVYSKGLLAREAAIFTLSSAERVTPGLAARLAQTLEIKQKSALIALDESDAEEQDPPRCLSERLAFHISLEGISAQDCPLPAPSKPTLCPSAKIDDSALRDITVLAAQLGISGLRAPLFTIRAAKAAASLAGRDQVSQGDLETAVALVLAPRATLLPDEAAPPEPEPAPPEPEQNDAQDSSATTPDAPPQDMLLEAALAALPPDLLKQLADQGQTSQASGMSASGSRKIGTQRGRPLPPRKGKPDGRHRIDLIATLRHAAPWQKMRAPRNSGLKLMPSDIHLKRFETRSDRLLIFAVDASGSAAMNRLGEAKGAVELLLADAYASRDHVTLISYNKMSAEVLLPPTRSLVRTKRHLAKLPGGGATPLAMGLKTALQTASAARRKGFHPALILIADGRTNIDLEGNPNRARAFQDALQIAKSSRAARLPGIVLDITKRPETQIKQVAEALNLTYLPLPVVDARTLSGAINAELASA